MTARTVPPVIGVYGGGRMGGGIAHAFAVVGARVIVVENSADSADAARRRIYESLAKAVAKGIEVTGSFEVVTDAGALAVPVLGDDARRGVDDDHDVGVGREGLRGAAGDAGAQQHGEHDDDHAQAQRPDRAAGCARAGLGALYQGADDERRRRCEQQHEQDRMQDGLEDHRRTLHSSTRKPRIETRVRAIARLGLSTRTTCAWPFSAVASCFWISAMMSLTVVVSRSA